MCTTGFLIHSELYSSQYDPDGQLSKPIRPITQIPSLRPTVYANHHFTMQSLATSTATAADFSSPIRPHASGTQPSLRQPQFRSTGIGDRGSLGVYTHANSPLRKAASTNFLREEKRERRRESSPVKRETGGGKRVREGSLLKRGNMGTGVATFDEYGRPSHGVVERKKSSPVKRETERVREGSPLKRGSIGTNTEGVARFDEYGRPNSSPPHSGNALS